MLAGLALIALALLLLWSALVILDLGQPPPPPDEQDEQDDP